MKKIISTILIGTILFSMVGCLASKSDENVVTNTDTDNTTMSGEVVAEG
jgi:amino acid permease